MAVGLLTIPEELLVNILATLDVASLIHCAMTCKSIYQTLKSASLLQYTIQLHLNGLKDSGASATQSYAELVELLHRRRQAWFTLNLTECGTRELQHECELYELSGSIFANYSQRYIESLWLPSPNEGSEGTMLKTASVGFSVSDFSIDPTQDMLALFEDVMGSAGTDDRTLRIHIRSIDTNGHHPLARQNPLILKDLSSSYEIFDPHLKIMQNTLILHFWYECQNLDQESRAVMWDWTTGDCIMDSDVAFGRNRPSDFEIDLLDSKNFFITSLSNAGSVMLYRLPEISSIYCPPKHVATLHLPPITEDAEVSKFCIVAGPIEKRPHSHAPFTVNDDDRLHVITVFYDHPGLEPNDLGSALNMFVHQRVFMKYASQVRSIDLPLDVPWEEWGPMNTRVIYPYCVETDSWTGYLHGQRIVAPWPWEEDDERRDESHTTVQILDFSLAAILSAKGVLPASASSDHGRGVLLSSTEPIETRQIPIFEEDIVTHLPCVSFRRNLGKEYSTNMIHAGGIIGVDIKSPDFRPILHLYTP